MGNVVQLTEPDFKNVSYIDVGGDLGVSTRCRSLQVIRLNGDEFEVITGLGSFVLSRDVLAEFLHVSSVFIDDSEKFKPAMDMISCDY